MRIGNGYDVHRLVKGRKLILGGVTIPFEKGLLGHSDADVLLHAVCDALLGAAGLGDIGLHFPDTDIQYKDISSMKLLSKICSMIADKGFAVVNLDTVILAEAPKISPYREEMKKKIAKAAGIEPKNINIKASTSEGLGFTGRGEGLAAMAIVLLEAKNG